MKVNLTDVFLNEGKILALEVPYEKEVFESQVGSFTIKEKTPVKLKIYIP